MSYLLACWWSQYVNRTSWWVSANWQTQLPLDLDWWLAPVLIGASTVLKVKENKLALFPVLTDSEQRHPLRNGCAILQQPVAPPCLPASQPACLSRVCRSLILTHTWLAIALKFPISVASLYCFACCVPCSSSWADGVYNMQWFTALF